MQVRPITAADEAAFKFHLASHIEESGANGVHFMPYDLAAGDRPRGPDFSMLSRSLTEPGWQRCFIAVDDSGDIVGHVDLKGAHIHSGLHRCVLGIGINREWRGRGLGRQLMDAAIEFARATPELHWIDLGVFLGNPRAHALYEKLGFVETGRREDVFRIGSESITDISMALNVARDAP